MPATFRESSLARFVRSEGLALLGYSGTRASARAQKIVGGALLGFAGFMALTPILGAEPGVIAGAIGPGIAGAINLFFGVLISRRVQEQKQAHVELSPGAKNLMLTLVRRLGLTPWGMNYRYGGPYGFGSRRAMRHGYAQFQDLREVALTDEVIDNLEQAAEQYNRISAVIEASNPANSALSNMTTRLASAAMEGMAEILHHASIVAQYPEGAKNAQAQMNSLIATLSELAKQAEDLAGQSPIAESSISSNSMSMVLEEMRLEQMARSELRSDTSETIEQKH